MTSECDAMRETMSELLDNRPGAAERRRLQYHLEGCRACQREWDSLRAVDELLSGAATVSPAAGFAVRFQARLVARRRRRQTLIGLLVLAAVTAFLLLMGIGLSVASALWTWPATAAWVAGLLSPVEDSLAALGRAVADSIAVALVILRALTRVIGHPYFLSSASLTLLLTAVWLWIVGVRPRSRQAVRA